MNVKISTIALPSRMQVDTSIAVFLLKEFGREKYPGVESAQVAALPTLQNDTIFEDALKEGVLMLDMGGGDLDHHGRTEAITISYLMAKHLGIEDSPAIKKLLDLALRDDQHGKGTISDDSLDKAFGLPGLLQSLNKSYPDDMHYVFSVIHPVLLGHYIEERKRTELMPKEVEELTAAGKLIEVRVKQGKKKLKVAVVQSDSMSLSGFLRSALGGRYDIVAQMKSTGHLNIVTRKTKRPYLADLAAVIRKKEIAIISEETGEPVTDLPVHIYTKEMSIEAVPHWYYDTATNSILNGGSVAGDIPATRISWDLLPEILPEGLNKDFDPNFRQNNKRRGYQGSKPFKKKPKTESLLEMVNRITLDDNKG